jgi:hypothetical protein
MLSVCTGVVHAPLLASVLTSAVPLRATPGGRSGAGAREHLRGAGRSVRLAQHMMSRAAEYGAWSARMAFELPRALRVDVCGEQCHRPAAILLGGFDRL